MEGMEDYPMLTICKYSSKVLKKKIALNHTLKTDHQGEEKLGGQSMLKFTETGYGNDVIRNDRKLNKS